MSTIPNLSDCLLLARAYAVAHPGTPAAEPMASGIYAAEGHVAAWHAIVVQGGMTSPQREAVRLSVDMGLTSRHLLSDNAALQAHMRQETEVDGELVAAILGPELLVQGVGAGLARLNPTPVAPPETNDRGEFTGSDGQLRHWDAAMLEHPDIAPDAHEGPWLTCDGCNPVVVIDATELPAAPGGNVSLLEIQRQEYSVAKEAADAAAERLKAATDRLKSAITEASGGAYRAVLKVPGYKALNLTYVESWRIDTKRLKAEQPAVYVEFAAQSGSWRLEQSKAKS